MRLSYTQLAKLTAGASGGLIATNAATSVAVMPTGGPQSMFGRTVRIGVPVASAAGIVYFLPDNEYTQGAAVGSALVAVSQLMSMATNMLTGPSGSGGNSGQSGMGAATQTAVMGGGIPASQSLSSRRESGLGLERSTDLMEGEEAALLEQG